MNPVVDRRLKLPQEAAGDLFRLRKDLSSILGYSFDVGLKITKDNDIYM